LTTDIAFYDLKKFCKVHKRFFADGIVVPDEVTKHKFRTRNINSGHWELRHQ